MRPVITISLELIFQILNTAILFILIPIAIYSLIKGYKKKRELVNIRISNLEEKINELENRIKEFEK